MPDTIESRSLPIRLKRKRKTESVESLGPRQLRFFSKEAESLRAVFQAWAASNVGRLIEADPDFPIGLTDRQEESAQPLLAIADLAGGKWSLRARIALVGICSGDRGRVASLGENLLRDIKDVFQKAGTNRLFSGTSLFRALRS